MYTKEQQIRKAVKIGEHEYKRRQEQKKMRILGANSQEWNNYKVSVKKRVFIEQGVAHSFAEQKRLVRMDSINRKGR